MYLSTQLLYSNVEEAIQSLPQSEPDSPHISSAQPSTPRRTPPPRSTSHVGEESAEPLSLSTPGQTLSDDARRLLQKTGDTISKPLNAIGRIFSEALDGPFTPFELGRESNTTEGQPPAVPNWSHPDQTRHYQGGSGSSSPGGIPQTPSGDGVYNPPIQTPYKPRVRRIPSPSYFPGQSPVSPGFNPEDTPSRGPYTNQSLAIGASQPLPRLGFQAAPPRVQSLGSNDPESYSAHVSRTPTPNLDFAGIQAEIDTAHEQAATAAKETLMQIFPSVDVEVVQWVLEANQGDLGKSIEGLLEMSSGS